jgi:hypothetical protein
LLLTEFLNTCGIDCHGSSAPSTDYLRVTPLRAH